MKTSNYILTGFLTFGFIIILSLFIDAKLHGKNSKNKESVFMTEEKLDHFSVLVVEEGANVMVSNGLENVIRCSLNSIEKPKNQPSPKKFLRISNDTLFVHKSESIYRLFVASKSIKKIIGNKNSKISIWKHIKDTLSVDLDESKLEWYSNNVNTKSLNIVAKNHSNINSMQTINYEVGDDGKKKRVYPEGMEFVKVSLKNHSKLRIKKPKRLDIEIDSTSSYSLFK